jgi:trehalose synthase
MLQSVDVGRQSLERYRESAGPDVVDQVRALAADLKGVRVLHVNATPYGGGVAEILRSEVPLLRDLGIAADWQLIVGDQAFFQVTKTIHNGLQGGATELTPADRATYLASSERNAGLLDGTYDLIVVHDPQPLALRHFHGKDGARWIWRCHIDTSEPNLDIWTWLQPFLADYDAAVFTLGSFVPPRLPVGRIEIVPPAIDPESPKNLELEPSLAQRVLQWIGVDTERPLVTQVSRFDPWKDPLGVIAAYRLVRAEIPDLQLALVGSMALDDPEGWDVYRQIQDTASTDPEIHVFTNLTGVGNIEVNAFQRLSDVVVQKSLREGFGLVVSETLWKGTPVVAGRAGGISLQMQDGAGGFLVDSVEECAERVLWLLRHRQDGDVLAEKGRALVRRRFLLPRLLADDLRLYAALLDRKPAPAVPPFAGLVGEDRDPVCGMALTLAEGSERPGFCSEACRAHYEANPKAFDGARTAGTLAGVDRASD